MAGQSRTLKLSILADVDQLKKSLKSANGDIETSSSKLGEFSKKAGLAFAAAAAAAGVMAVKIGIDAVKAASDLSETISKVGVLFGETSKDIEVFASKAAGALGQTKQQALNAAATFATFGKAAGLSGEDLSKFSIDFVKLSSDLASFNNTSPEQAINAIGSALRGEAEPLRAYGVLLDDASLRQAALELGIINTTKNALTPQQKVLAAQALIYKQTSTAQGDFERTSDGLANKTRILTAQFENAKTAIGEKLLPIVLQVVSYIEANVIPALGKFAQFFKPITDAIDKNKEAFIEFIGFIQKYVVPVLVTVLGGAFKVVGEIAGGIINVIGKVIAGLNALISGAVAGINALIRVYNSIPFLPNVSQISAPSISVPKVTIPKTTTSTSSIPTISVPSVTASTGTGSTSTSSSSGVKSAASGASSVSSAFPFGTSGVDTTTLAGIMKASGSPINVTVNGAIDAEGTARTIVKTLNDSFYRGTGGASALQAI